ncbi:MAG TPA: nuclear transport factor 2 family protein [Rubrobacter sp.]|nr:nuclear transport factor 2 family protein [Rubrobacter sp.]
MIYDRPRHGSFPVPGEFMEDAETVRAAYRALEAGDVRTLTRYLDPQVAWVHPAVARLPFDGLVRGLPAVLRSAFRREKDGGGPRASAGTLLELGDSVLVVGRFAERHGTEEFEVPFMHECFVRDGRIFRIREYPAKS